MNLNLIINQKVRNNLKNDKWIKIVSETKRNKLYLFLFLLSIIFILQANFLTSMHFFHALQLFVLVNQQ